MILLAAVLLVVAAAADILIDWQYHPLYSATFSDYPPEAVAAAAAAVAVAVATGPVVPPVQQPMQYQLNHHKQWQAESTFGDTYQFL